MTGLARLTAVLLFALAWTWPGSAQAVDVDLELVLAVDVSRSVDDDEFELQRQGYAEAFMHPSVINAIQSNPRRRIAVIFIEWAGADFQNIVIPWTVVSDAESGALFSEQIMKAKRSFRGWTSISGAVDFGVQNFATNPHKGTRRVIDVSGDGVNNSGRPATAARDDAVAAGITVNGLVIMNDRPTPGFSFQTPQPPLDEYFRENVVGGPGAFVAVAEDFQTFAYAVLNKLIKEIAEDSSYRGLARVPDGDDDPQH
jgi:hypothetical protein